MDNSDISSFMCSLLEKYKVLRGNSKDCTGEEFWDVAVITTADQSQKKAYEIQIEEKRARNELPSDLPLIVVADPPGVKIGNGGSTLVALELLHEKYGEKLFELKIMIIHAGGWSQRMPNASILGKIFTALPHGEPVYQMLDMKLAMYWPFVKRMKAGVFIVCADDILTYNLGSDSDWSVSEYGFTALAHPSTMKIGNTHGVYVVANPDKINKSKHIVEAECLEILQKPSDKRMEDTGAVVTEEGVHEFADGITVEGRMVYTDSSFFFGVDVVKKLLSLKKELGVLTCEIDAYGDFLQALGPRANEKYITNTANISEVTQNLTECRLKVFQVLQNTDLHLILMHASKFNHIGTTHEYLHHLCQDSSFKSQLCLESAVFNKWQETHASPEKKRKKLDPINDSCVMHSSLLKSSVIQSQSVVEYCQFDRPVNIGTNSIISNCQLLATDELNTSVVEIPSHIFIHTVAICSETFSKFVTIFFQIDDNLKKTVATANILTLPFMKSNLENVAQALGVETFDTTCINGQCSLWNIKLFPAENTMTASFQKALEMISCIKSKSKSLNDKSSSPLYSFSDLLKYKDVSTMIKYRQSLFKLIENSMK
ncbi:fucose-1-phosphate guanylyltransferase [Patella vulgata]|uniref:fucose-1-phosphate guanylyltransferase n=1 Tax=Patella vulgata TaxID=6465 RepID=UPI00218069FB|nr:fucose-1-phosphate guanylyltransferase [Patella vulgata]